MTSRFSPRQGWPVYLLLIAAGLAAPSPRVSAQGCPPNQTITIVRPPGGAGNICGQMRIDVTITPPAAGWIQDQVIWHIYDFTNSEYCHGPCFQTGPTTYSGVVDTTVLPNAFWYIRIFTGQSRMGADCTEMTPPGAPQFFTNNPCQTRSAYRSKLQQLFCRGCACTESATDPLTGDQSFTVPVTSWDYKGATIPFSLTYDSASLVDPQQQPEANFNGLSQRNSKWSQPFASWIDLWQDESGSYYAVVHRGNSTLAFQETSSTSNVWTSPDSYNSLLGDGVKPPAQMVTCPTSSMLGTQNVVAANSTFTLTDADGTKYLYGMLYWQTATCAALPHYLLTKITDRWGRVINITWTSMPVGGGSEPRITSVMDAGDASIGQNPSGITLSYPNGDGLLRTVSDPQGRTHTLTYSAVPDEEVPTANPLKLTSVLVSGPGMLNRVQWLWKFGYQIFNPDGTVNTTATNAAYNNSYTGDLVVSKQDPTGQVVNYTYEQVAFAPMTNNERVREQDWDGRMSQVTWTDTDPATDTNSTARTITRGLDPSGSPATISYPGPPGQLTPIQYGYTGTDVTSVTDVLATQADPMHPRKWTYLYDGSHNLKDVRSPLELTLTPPLVHYDYTFSGAQISQVNEQVLQQSLTSVGDLVSTQLTTDNLPTQVTAYSRDGMHDQTTTFQYDGGTFSKGNLTQIVEAVGKAEQQATAFSYGGTDGPWGLPDMATNAVGGVSMFGYDHPSGRLLTAASPTNSLLTGGDPDIPASTTTLAYNTDGLPSMVADPKGHTVQIAYNAVTPGAANLIVTLTTPENVNGSTQNFYRQFIVDPRGRITQDVDEAGVVTQWTYNAEDQVTSVKRDALGTPNLTRFYYTSRGDLDHFDPPNGPAGGVYFEYGRYTLDQNNHPVANGAYEGGQVTRIKYPPTPSDNMLGTSEYFGYNNADELVWRVKGDGSLINISRDWLHRISQISYPATAANGPFNVTASYDEFGRIGSTVDQQGTTTLVYDNLNRLMKAVPPAPQREVDYGYTADNAPTAMPPRHRWITTVTVPGSTAYTYQYQEDNKGRLYQVVSPFNQTTTLHYDLDGKNVETDLPNGVKELRGYLEPQDWLASIQIKQPNNNVLDQLTYSYTDALSGHYDPTGHLRQETDSANKTHAFSFNALYELTHESHPDFGVPGTIDYQYDANGNRLSRTLNGSVVDDYVSDLNNKLEWVNRGSMGMPTSGQANPYMLFGYDANGNTTSRERRYDNGLLRSFTLDWDGDDNLRHVYQAGALWMLAFYNGDGLRVNKQDFWTPWHHYTWGLGGVLVDSSDGGNGVNNTIVYTPGVSQNVNGTDSFFDTDWLGSTRYLTDSTGDNATAQERYDAFGEVSYTNPANWDPSDYQWAGADWGYQAEWSASYEPGIGLEYLENRYYDPAVGRFVAPDPAGLDNGMTRYGYADSNPVDAVDPLGLQDAGDDDLLLSGRQLYRQLGRQFAARPEFRPGSRQRVSYSRFLDTLPVIGQAKQAWQAISGRDSVGGGRRSSLRDRVASALFVLLSVLPGGEEEEGVVCREPESVRFSQNSVRWGFKDKARGTIGDLIAGLRSGDVKPEDVPPIRLVEREGHLITIDNRRLVAFREAGIPIRTRMATAREVRAAIREGKFSAGRLGTVTTRIRGR